MRSTMRSIVFVIAALSALPSFGARVDKKTIDFDSLQPAQTIELKAEKFKTLYHERYVSKTCSRQVPDGTSYECGYENDYSCTPTRVCDFDSNGNRSCHIVDDCSGSSHYVCRDVTRYATEYYDCSYTDYIPYEVKDYDVEMKLTIAASKDIGVQRVVERLQMELNGENLTIRGLSNNKDTVLFGERTSKEKMANGTKEIETLVEVSTLPIEMIAAPLKGKLKVLEVSEQGTVVFSTSPIESPNLFAMAIEVRKPGFLSKGKLIKNGSVSMSAAKLLRQGKVSEWSLDLSQIGLDVNALAKGSYKLNLSLKTDIALEKVLNPQILPKALEIAAKSKLKKK